MDSSPDPFRAISLSPPPPSLPNSQDHEIKGSLPGLPSTSQSPTNPLQTQEPSSDLIAPSQPIRFTVNHPLFQNLGMLNPNRKRSLITPYGPPWAKTLAPANMATLYYMAQDALLQAQDLIVEAYSLTKSRAK